MLRSARRPLSELCLLTAALCVTAALCGNALPAAAVERIDDPTAGRDSYIAQCARCHQGDGAGIDGLYPSLRNLDDDAAGREAAIGTLLSGRVGVFDVDGVTMDRVMPTHGYLGNETIAATLTYVFTEWGADATPVTTEEVAAIRLTLVSGHPSDTDTVTGVSPLAELDASQYVTSSGPAISVEEFERARRLYYGRCTGCHGVLREGVAGKPLTPEIMRQQGTEYLRSVISYGSSAGMPNWGTSADLGAEDIELLARFLQHPVPQPPDMDAYQIRDGWHLVKAPAERPALPEHDYDIDRMFVAALHDVGEIALFDGVGKTLIARVPVGRAPHRITASASGRFLYVIGRDGTLSQIDLYASPPATVASVRVGYEARTLAASSYPGFEDRYVLAGAYWPPQLVLLDGRTLEPLRLISTRGYTARGHRYHPEPRVSDIASSPAYPEFISHIKETGHTFLLPYDGDLGLLEIDDLEDLPELRAGSFSSDGRYYLTPTDGNAVSVFDVTGRSVVARIPARVFGGNSGVGYRHARLGPVWVTSTMVDRNLVVIGTDPAAHPEAAWRVLQEIPGPASGSLFVATHEDSRHLWMDTPLTASGDSQTATVFARDDLEAGYQSLPVGRWSGLKEGPRRVIQPTYSADGREVWLVVWNPQDQGSAIVVVDDASLEPVATIRTPDLITPTRLYNVAALRNAEGVAGAATRAGAVPAGADLYARHCANCHGVYGEGDGPMAPSLSMTLNDLRYLSARNSGEYPREFVRRIIDGRASHGPADMPVWGAEFRSAEGDDGGDASEARSRQRIAALADFLESVQVATPR
ncbi:MAG: cytochrome D1 domain-containing protein [Pseudomonadales bacterium]